MCKMTRRWSLAGLLTGGLFLFASPAIAEVNEGPFFPEQCVPDFPDFNGEVPNGENGEFIGFALVEIDGIPFSDCSQLEPGSETLTPWLQQIILSERLFKLSGIVNNRLRGGGGGGTVLAHGGGDLAGRAAGDMLSNLSAWLSYGHTFADNDRPSTEFDATQHNLLAGVDYAFSDQLLAGLVFGYESSDFDTPFNAGELQISGYTVAPYVAYLINDNFSVDATAGYSNLGIRQSRTDPFQQQPTVKGNTTTDRWFVASNLNAFTYWRDFALNGRVGLVYAEDRQRGFTESGGFTAQRIGSETYRFGQVQVGGEVAYVVHAIEPFASAYYQYDFEREKIRLNRGQQQPSDDRDDVRVSAGLRYFGNNGISGILEYSKIVGRQDFGADTINLMLRMQF
jgi:hypothetical protein